VNIPLLYSFGGHGAILGTILGYAVSDLIMIFYVIKYTKFDYIQAGKSILRITLYSAVMGAAVVMMRTILDFCIPGKGYMKSLITVVLCAGTGAAVYFILVWKSNIASDILGKQIYRIPFLKRLKKAVN
jgi:O-antigen/teichoic acid export membrane protein